MTTDNVTIRTWGAPAKFEFAPKDHIDILTELGLVDIERAAKIAGGAVLFLKGDAVKARAIDNALRSGRPVEEGLPACRASLHDEEEAYSGVTDLRISGRSSTR